ncbi:unnamed protein product [Didymodactylos carnosus]|uniref:Nucleoside phosphorylase domain-containing protein n=1 Tax=Didymodactylos carnosus TaxID=1234261 RepID=A0A8S2CQ71_9BILA|nr:unnamed protein product [Didymodactylos carnosus]CAF3491985.1 unnamed protein product [Didymodactylos carnosus]
MLIYTGKYKGQEVTVMGHGMGIPSIGIYSYELYRFYGVQTIIRMGSAGSYLKHIKVRDIFIVESAYSESSYAYLMKLDVQDKVLYATPALLERARQAANELNISYHQGRANAEDAFYNAFTLDENIRRTNSDVVEMEAFGLYANAIKLQKEALVLLTISDSLVAKEEIS